MGNEDNDDNDDDHHHDHDGDEWQVSKVVREVRRLNWNPRPIANHGVRQNSFDKTPQLLIGAWGKLKQNRIQTSSYKGLFIS